MAKASGARRYLYELDPIRGITAICVVGVHVTAGTLIFYHTAIGVELQNAALTALHFTREIFLMLTAFVLVYGYAHKPFSLATFWRKRGIGVLLPYVIWSVFYVWFAYRQQPITTWLWPAVIDTLTGNSSYQMYYILLTLEFYVVLPAFLWFLSRVGRHPWIVLGISFAVQLGVVYLDYQYVQTGALAGTAFGNWVNVWLDRTLLIYQFPIMLGGMAALYMQQVRAFVLCRGHWVVLGLVVGLGVHWLHYWVLVAQDPRTATYAASAIQPTMVVYSASIALFLYWIACRWAARAPAGAAPRGHQFWSAISNASFGIYLVHAFILTSIVLPLLAPALPAWWPAPMRVGLIWLIVASSSTAISLGFLYVPGLSRLMGRACLLPADSAPMRALAAVRRYLESLWPDNVAQAIPRRAREPKRRKRVAESHAASS
jgi:probable poly-beta-1,6-N-acetyl-D-glucosamine export protein